MLIIGLQGSPRLNSNTFTLLDLALKGAREEGVETEMIFVQKILREQKYPYCVNCVEECTGACYRGTALEEVFELFSRADGIILASPVYYGTISGQIKGLWDKTRRLRNNMMLYNVVGGAISVGRMRFGGQETTLKTMFDMMLVQGMLLTGDGHFSTDAGYHGVCAQEPVAKDMNALKRALAMGKRMAEVAKSTASLRVRRGK